MTTLCQMELLNFLWLIWVQCIGHSINNYTLHVVKTSHNSLLRQKTGWIDLIFKGVDRHKTLIKE